MSETTIPHVDLAALFRRPSSLSDNCFSWLEPTRCCDLDCDYCYQEHDLHSHKALEEFEEAVRGLLRLRRTGGVIVVGGEPLTHPHIVELVKMVASYTPKVVRFPSADRLTERSPPPRTARPTGPQPYCCQC